MPSPNMMPHQITVLSKSTANVGGGQVATYNYAYRNVASFVQPASSRRVDYYAARNIVISHEIYVGQALTVTVGAIVQFNSRSFYITGFRNLLEWDRVFVMDAREITGTEIIIEST